jgi:hypothetical protein
VLELEPYSDGPQASDSAFVPVKAQHQLLFLETRLEEDHSGYLLLDTGSSYNVISNTAATALRQPRAPSGSLPLVAGSGKISGRLLPGRVSFRYGSRMMALDPVVAVDLEELSRRHSMDVVGVIGYPALAGSVVTVNYRESLVRVQSK